MSIGNSSEQKGIQKLLVPLLLFMGNVFLIGILIMLFFIYNKLSSQPILKTDRPFPVWIQGTALPLQITTESREQGIIPGKYLPDTPLAIKIVDADPKTSLNVSVKNDLFSTIKVKVDNSDPIKVEIKNERPVQVEVKNEKPVEVKVNQKDGIFGSTPIQVEGKDGKPIVVKVNKE
jgi:hypothetical protein